MILNDNLPFSIATPCLLINPFLIAPRKSQRTVANQVTEPTARWAMRSKTHVTCMTFLPQFLSTSLNGSVCTINLILSKKKDCYKKGLLQLTNQQIKLATWFLIAWRKVKFKQFFIRNCLDDISLSKSFIYPSHVNQA